MSGSCGLSLWLIHMQLQTVNSSNCMLWKGVIVVKEVLPYPNLFNHHTQAVFG